MWCIRRMGIHTYTFGQPHGPPWTWRITQNNLLKKLVWPGLRRPGAVPTKTWHNVTLQILLCKKGWWNLEEKSQINTFYMISWIAQNRTPKLKFSMKHSPYCISKPFHQHIAKCLCSHMFRIQMSTNHQWAKNGSMLGDSGGTIENFCHHWKSQALPKVMEMARENSYARPLLVQNDRCLRVSSGFSGFLARMYVQYCGFHFTFFSKTFFCGLFWGWTLVPVHCMPLEWRAKGRSSIM